MSVFEGSLNFAYCLLKKEHANHNAELMGELSSLNPPVSSTGMCCPFGLVGCGAVEYFLIAFLIDDMMDGLSGFRHGRGDCPVVDDRILVFIGLTKHPSFFFQGN